MTVPDETHSLVANSDLQAWEGLIGEQRHQIDSLQGENQNLWQRILRLESLMTQQPSSPPTKTETTDDTTTPATTFAVPMTMMADEEAAAAGGTPPLLPVVVEPDEDDDHHHDTAAASSRSMFKNVFILPLKFKPPGMFCNNGQATPTTTAPLSSSPLPVVVPFDEAERAREALFELNALFGLPAVIEELEEDLPTVSKMENSLVDEAMQEVEDDHDNDDDDDDDDDDDTMMVDPLDAHMVGRNLETALSPPPRRSGGDYSVAGTSIQTARTIDSQWDQMSLVRTIPFGFANHCSTAGAAWITTL